MVGRKRKQGRRERNGQLQRPSAAETAWETKRPVLEKRCDQLGWARTVENLRRVDKYGTFWGLYFLGGLLNERQHEAADQFAVLRREYLLSTGLPSDTSSGSSWGDATGPSPMLDPSDADIRKVAAYRDMARHLGPDSVFAILDLVTGEGVIDAALLLGALDEVADYLRLEEAA